MRWHRSLPCSFHHLFHHISHSCLHYFFHHLFHHLVHCFLRRFHRHLLHYPHFILPSFSLFHMVKEPHTKRQRPPTATDAMSRLVQKAKNLAILGCLTTNEKHRVAHAITISQSTQTAWKRQKYKLFLCNILECSGPHSFLLCYRFGPSYRREHETARPR